MFSGLLLAVEYSNEIRKGQKFRGTWQTRREKAVTARNEAEGGGKLVPAPVGSNLLGKRRDLDHAFLGRGLSCDALCKRRQDTVILSIPGHPHAIAMRRNNAIRSMSAIEHAVPIRTDGFSSESCA